MADEFKSRVYTDRPPYADFDAPAKFEAIKSIVAKRLREHPNAVCSYSGGSDSDIMIHMIEQVRKLYELPPVQYCFFNTGLEMQATKRHVKDMAEKYGVTITEHRPKKNIVLATREHGIPFVSKIMSAGLEGVQKKNIPLSIADEYAEAEDKPASLMEAVEGIEPKVENLHEKLERFAPEQSEYPEMTAENGIDDRYNPTVETGGGIDNRNFDTDTKCADLPIKALTFTDEEILKSRHHRIGRSTNNETYKN